MNTRAALRQAIERLTAAQVPSATTTAEVLLLHVLNHDRTFLYAHPETELTLEQERAYRHLVSERAAGKPTQYLTGEQEFWGLSFRVTPGVFIPRPETEHVVEVALAIVRERLRLPRARIVDVGTGTGCIALALASELPEAEIIGVDIDPNALAVARENAARLRLAHRVRFEASDLLGAFLPVAETEAHGSRATSHEPRFDLIVSNPPYVSETEAEQLPREVREHEPPAALGSPDEGLGLTRRLIEQAEQLLVAGRGLALFTPSAAEGSEVEGSLDAGGGPARRSPQSEGGWLVLELGYQMAGRVRALLGEAWTNIEITDDLRGIPRVLAAQKI
jgi:release factor glutamine methyltransferase